MEIYTAVHSLSALAHELRLGIFRLLVEAGPDGLPAGQIGERLRLPGPTLSFHLAHLKNAGLIECVRRGRSLIYTADYSHMNELLGYLTKNCCRDSGNAECCPTPNISIQPKERKRDGRSRL